MCVCVRARVRNVISGGKESKGIIYYIFYIKVLQIQMVSSIELLCSERKVIGSRQVIGREPNSWFIMQPLDCLGDGV